MFGSLTCAQRQAVEYATHAAVLAGPGSGKTHLTISKVIRILQQTSDRVLVVTFTNAAVHELKARLKSACPAGVQRVICGTFHSLAKKQLEKGGDNSIQFSRNVDEFEAANSVLKKFPECTLSVERLISKIALLQSRCPARQMKSEDYNYLVEFKKYMNAAGLRTFADLIIEANVKMNAGTLAPFDVEHVLVDEAQDIDENQFQWVLEHMKQRGSILTLVGDDDQSLYGWRGGMGVAAFNLAKRNGAKIFILDRNFRSLPKIVENSSQLMSHGTNRIQKRIEPQKQGSALIKAYAVMDLAHECDLILDQIGQAEGGFAILARTKFKLKLVASQLDAANIQYVFVGENPKRFRNASAAFLEMLISLERGTGAGVVSAINLLAQSGDFMNLSWSPRASHVLDQLKEALERDFPSADRDQDHRAFFLKQLVSLWPQWVQFMEERRTDHLVEIVKNWVMSTFSYDENGDLTQEDRWINFWVEKAATMLLSKKGSLSARIDRLLEEPAIDIGDAKVVLMTIHGSKGREFDEVWLAGAEVGAFPSERGDFEEERRLMFVALSRARSKFFSSYLGEKGPSPFLIEAGIVG